MILLVFSCTADIVDVAAIFDFTSEEAWGE